MTCLSLSIGNVFHETFIHRLSALIQYTVRCPVATEIIGEHYVIFFTIDSGSSDNSTQIYVDVL